MRFRPGQPSLVNHTPATDHAPLRTRQRLNWVRRALGDAQIELERASADAGFRSYWRARRGDARWIVMDAPPALEDVRPWLRAHAVLLAAEVRVPAILARDIEHGFLLLEDLGTDTLRHLLDADNADHWFDAAIEQLLRLQRMPVPAGLARFDEPLLQREAALFEDWFLRRHLGLALDCGDSERLQQVQRRLIDNALGQPQVPTHRDFMPRNLMPQGDHTVAVLDFQDLALGPLAYDPISLFKDAFLSWPPPRVDGWLAHYHQRARAAGLPIPALALFRRDADWIGVQRHLKVLGIFARLHHRDGKPQYLADAPRFISYLEDVLPRHPPLHPLLHLLENTIKPAMRRIWAE